MPKISVIIPAYNAMTYLPETLTSVLRQTNQDFEVLIINDGSADGIETWISTISDPRIQLISQTNQGPAAARNTGIRHASGEYIAFLDADDLLDPTKLEKEVNCLDADSSVGLVYSWTAMIDEHGEATGRVMDSHADGNVLSQILVKNIVNCPSVMIRRSCFEQVGYFEPDLRFNEDWEMWIRIAKQFHFAVIKEPLVYYRQHPNNASKNWQRMEAGYYFVIEKAFQSAPANLQVLKNLSYGHANFCLAWKALQSQERDYKLAARFRKTALEYSPKLRLTKEHLRLSTAIALMWLLGSNGYTKALELAYKIRRLTLKQADQIPSLPINS